MTGYFRACVDSFTGEANGSNNCSETEDIVVVPASKARLVPVITSVGGGLPLYSGAEYDVLSLVGNEGDATSIPTDLRYHRSTDQSTSSDDEELGSDTVQRIQPGSNTREDITLRAPHTPGTPYFYYVCVDAKEGNEGDHCSGLLSSMVLDPLFFSNETCTTHGWGIFSDKTYKFEARINAITDVSEVVVAGAVQFYNGNSRLSNLDIDVRQTYGSLRQGQSMNISIEGSGGIPAGTRHECVFRLSWSY